jgi:hypothetical protein
MFTAALVMLAKKKKKQKQPLSFSIRKDKLFINGIILSNEKE